MPLMVVITTIDPATGEGEPDVFEVTPPPEPGRERAVLSELVRGIHPGAVERGWDDGVATFAEGPRTITATFAMRGDGRPPVSQATLFD